MVPLQRLSSSLLAGSPLRGQADWLGWSLEGFRILGVPPRACFLVRDPQIRPEEKYIACRKNGQATQAVLSRRPSSLQWEGKTGIPHLLGVV